MPQFRASILVALALSLAIHLGLLAPWTIKAPPTTTQNLQVNIVERPIPERPDLIKPSLRERPKKVKKAPIRVADSAATPPLPEKILASMPAPSPPSAEEWKLAANYTLKNSKRYRHNWGQQVRSMMGTAVEGPDQGQVRFRIEIAPDGKIAKIDELWSTSAVASKLAWNAIRSLPPLPPSPTGKPIVFEQTISFLPYETGWPPSYKLDCLPEPPVFQNPYAWDGASPQPVAKAPTHRAPIPEDCVYDSTSDTIEEEERELKRQMNQWRWGS